MTFILSTNVTLFQFIKKGKYSQVTYGKVRPEEFGTPGIPVPGAAIVPSGG